MGIASALHDRKGDAAYQVAIQSLLVPMVTGNLIVRGVPEGIAQRDEDNLAAEASCEPTILPLGELPP